MNKFKFEPPHEQRRSIQQKNYDVAILNTLEKCTQIIREDRLFLRAEIIHGNNQVIELLRKFSKHSQLQNLQIKLRKYMQSVKTQLKVEQLHKFKETLKTNTTASTNKRENHQLKPFLSTLKQPLKPNYNTQMNRSESTRNIKSQQHYSTNTFNPNNSLKHFQDLLKLKYNQEVIEERQSENVTSARQGRYQHEQAKGKPLQEQLFDSIDNKIAGRVTKNLLPSKINEKLHKSFNTQKQKPSKQSNLIHSPWQFEKKAKKVLYSNKSNESKEIEQIQKSLCRHEKEDKYLEALSQEESIYDKHFNESNNNSVSQQEQNSFLSQSCLPQYRNINGFLLKDLSVPNNNKFEQKQAAKVAKVQSVQSNEVQIKPQEQVSKNQEVRIQNPRKSEENLFTPLDLLNECRNFLKFRDSSNSKLLNSIVQGNSEKTNEKAVIQVSPQVQLCLFNRNNNKQQLQIKPQIVNQSMNNDLPIKSEIKPKTLPIKFSIEEFLECLMQITEMDPFIASSSFTKYINLHQNSEILKNIFKQELQSSKAEQICLTKLAEKLNVYYNQSLSTVYPHNDPQINTVYNLLDIDQKGFISQYDITSFLEQIEEAQVQNYDTVSSQLWRLFNGADFANEHRITYWHFYLIKNSQEFQSVKQLLDDFDFQIERND